MKLESQEIELKSFSDYERCLCEIFEAYEALKKGKRELAYYPLLFRGHHDSNWDLSTTLERIDCKNISFKDYAWRASTIRSKVSTFANKQWDFIPSDLNLDNLRTPLDLLPTTRNDKIYHLYEFLVYLRHNTYPSPLLDWTMSPYVALFFAFDYMGKVAPSSGKVSLFCYVETKNAEKEGIAQEDMIWSIGDDLVAHKRHFLQQCRYTVCLKKVNGVYVFGSHDRVVSRKKETQDIVIKMLIPFSVRKEVVAKLKLMNIGPYQLFDSEDSLVHSLAYETF